MYRYALSIIGGLFIGWNICLAATNSDLHSRNAEGGGNFDPLLTLSQDELLRRLDSLVAERKEAIRLKLHRIDTYRNDLHKSRTPRDRYAAALHLYNEFQKFQLDSALRYSDRLETYARQLGDPQRINAARLIRCKNLIFLGMYKAAADQLEAIPAHGPEFDSVDYYNCYLKLYHTMAQTAMPARCNANTDG